jgi:hypothetical protein
MNKFFIRVNIKIKNKEKEKEIENTSGKYEWRIIEKEENIKELIDKLSDKGVHESALKKKMSSICHKRMGYKNNRYNNNNANNNNNEDNNNQENGVISIEDIFKNKVLKYENIKNPLRYQKNCKINNIITSKTNQYEIIYDKLCNIEEIITNYLSHDSKQWESFINRTNIKAWITYINDIKQYVNLLLFLNDRVKNPYKIEEANISPIGISNKPNKKIIEDDIDNEENNNINKDNKNGEDNLIDNNGNLNQSYVNNSLQLGNKIRLWSKEFESYNLEDIYLEYLNSVNSFPMLHICIDMFEIVLNDLSKRREYFKKKGEDLMGGANKNYNDKKDIKVYL